MASPQTHGTGLIRQPVDLRDFQMKDMIPGLGTPSLVLPPTANTSKFSHRIENQGDTNRCTAFSSLKLWEIQRARQGLPYIDTSKDWNYIHSRMRDSQIAGNHGVIAGDSGATNRQAIMSLVKDGGIGLPHKRADGLWVGWPDSKETMDIDPEAWWHQTKQPWNKPPFVLNGLYEVDEDPQISAHHHQAITVRAVTAPSGAELILAAKGSIAHGFPFNGGIPAKQSLYDVGRLGIMTIPTATEQMYGYHSIVFANYDDTMSVDGHTGFFGIINSWDVTWGQEGIGWMPYAWFLDPTCCPFDCWAIHWAQ